MTNADKYLRDGVDVEEFVSKFEEYYDTKAENYIGTKIDFLKAFLREPTKPTLTEDEKVILRNIDKEIQYITRDKSGYLYITEHSFSVVALPFSIYNHLFQFIQPRRRI